jgi:hypothetical protein
VNRPEAATQRKIAVFLSKYLPEDAWFTAVAPSTRHDTDDDTAWFRGVMARDMGAKAGVPDMLLTWRGRAYWGEVKSMKGSLTDAQKYTIPKIESAGCPVAIWRSVDDVRASLIAWGIPIREEPISTERIRHGWRAFDETRLEADW